MGEVYRARDTRLGREVAIKVLPGALAQNAYRLQRFEQEARLPGTLNHPNLLAIFDVGREDGLQYLVSELLEGKSQRERLNDGVLPQCKVMEYSTKIASGRYRDRDIGGHLTRHRQGHGRPPEQVRGETAGSRSDIFSFTWDHTKS